MPQLKRTATGVLGGFAGLVGLSAIAGVLITATVTPAIAVSGYAATSALDTFDNMPSFLQVDKLMMPTQLYRKDTAGNDVMMAEFYDQNRIPVTWEQVNPVMYDAIISSEDKNFYTHGGIDFVGTVGALVGNASSGTNRGGSSITQQYVKNVLQQNCESGAVGDEEVQACYEQTTANTGSAGYQRKLQEMRYAIQLEKQTPKNDILLGYLNITNFGGITYGIGAAAQRYFGVNAADLTIAQAATLAGMVQEPNTYRIDRTTGANSAEDGFSGTTPRRNYVLGRMLEDGKITQAEYDEAKASPITPTLTDRVSGCQTAYGAEFFCQAVQQVLLTDPAFGDENERTANLRRGGMKIYTTLDADLQAAANDAITVVPPNVTYMDLGATGVQVEVGTGRVLSMTQNRPFSIDDVPKNSPTTQINFNVRQKLGGGIGFPAGSTYKLFSLVNWLEQGRSVNEVIDGRVGTKKIENCEDTGDVQTVVASNSERTGEIGNFEKNPGYRGTIYNFTKDSLNSGFLEMAETISVCSTNRLAMKMGVMRGDGSALDQQNVAYDVLGSQNVAPLDMAQAYATIASNGVKCESKFIDLALDSDGNDITPQTTCERTLSEAVASTAAYALQGVMNGTGSGARIGDGVPVLGKTGIHEYEQTWMDGASTKVATVVWVGNVDTIEVNGKPQMIKLNRYRQSGYQLSRIRNSIWPAMQGAANDKFGGERFASPDTALTKQAQRTLPSVIGMSVDEATRVIENAGFEVTVGDAVDGVEPAGTVIAQLPGAGRVAAGITVAINPSNGEGIVIPGVSGTPDDAERALRSAGFGSTTLQCTVSDAAASPTVTGTSPATGTVANRNAEIAITYQATSCDGRTP